MKIQFTNDLVEQVSVKENCNVMTIANEICRKHKLDIGHSDLIAKKIAEAVLEGKVLNAENSSKTKYPENIEDSDTDLSLAIHKRRMTPGMTLRSSSCMETEHEPSMLKKSVDVSRIDYNKSNARKRKPSYGEELYERGIKQKKAQITKRYQCKKEIDKREMKELTFAPQINKNSKLIMMNKQGMNNRMENNIEQSNSKRTVIKSKAIVAKYNKYILKSNTSQISADNTHEGENKAHDVFDKLFECSKKRKINSRSFMSEDFTFHPKINEWKKSVVLDVNPITGQPSFFSNKDTFEYNRHHSRSFQNKVQPNSNKDNRRQVNHNKQIYIQTRECVNNANKNYNRKKYTMVRREIT